MDVLTHLVGSWSFVMQHHAVGSPVTGHQSYELVLDDAFVLHRWTYQHPDFPDALGLLTADRYHYFDVRGVTRVFTVELSDAGWQMTHLDPAFSQRFVAHFDGADRIEGFGETSADTGVTWKPDFTIVYARSG